MFLNRTLLQSSKHFFLLIGLAMTSVPTAKAQDCAGGDETEFGINHWIGHAYQLPFFAARPAKDFVGQEKYYKGKLTEDMLSTDSINFNIRFGDTDQTADANDNDYFHTQCDSVKKQYFGISFRSRYTIPDDGVYEITINQDDGSSLRINGVLFHYYWDRFKHNAHGEGKYYRSYKAGQVLDMVIHFFEKFSTNQISFSIKRYYGPGIISRTQPEICTVDPNPDPFLSVAEAAFVSGNPPRYQWQYARNPEAPDSGWTDIVGATGSTYDIPRHSDNPHAFTGKMYFRRAAFDPGHESAAPIHTEPIDITLTLAGNVDQTEFGNMQWYGYVYDNYSNFNPGDFIGRLIYPKDVIEYKANFEEYFKGATGQFNGASSSNVPGATFSGCAFEKETFSVRYTMKMPVTPGTYNFRVRGDDGFRLKISDGTKYLVPVNGEWAIDKWTNGNKPFEDLTADIEIKENTTLYFTLEFTENGGDNIIEFESFKDIFGVLPVEWGRVFGDPCGENNCINWETIQEKNTSYFEVERSKDGIHWTNLGMQVPAAGYSTEGIHYDIKDNGFSAKSTFYRVKQVDLDESYGYSDVIRVDNDNYGRFTPYPFPNPTRDKIRFYSKEAIFRAELISQDYKIYLVPETTKVGEHLYEIDMERLNNMHYILTVISTSGEREVFKIMKE